MVSTCPNDLVFRKNYSEIPGNGLDDDDNGFIDDFDGWNSLDNSDNLPEFSHGTHVRHCRCPR